MFISVLQNMLFYILKAALLQGKRAAFGVQNLRFRNVKAQLSVFNGIIFTKPEMFLGILVVR